MKRKNFLKIMALAPVALMANPKPKKKVIEGNINKITFGKDSYVVFKHQQPGLSESWANEYAHHFKKYADLRSKPFKPIMRDEMIDSKYWDVSLSEYMKPLTRKRKINRDYMDFIDQFYKNYSIATGIPEKI